MARRILERLKKSLGKASLTALRSGKPRSATDLTPIEGEWQRSPAACKIRSRLDTWYYHNSFLSAISEQYLELERLTFIEMPKQPVRN
jgi:hypothetical protein